MLPWWCATTKACGLARAEDSPGTLDPVLEYIVPDKVTAMVVGVIDPRDAPEPRRRLSPCQSPATAAARQTRLSNFRPRAAGRLPVEDLPVMPVLVDRAGFEGSVELSAEGLPAGVQIEGHAIPEGADGTGHGAARQRGWRRGDYALAWQGRQWGGASRRHEGASAGTAATLAGDRNSRGPIEPRRPTTSGRLARPSRGGRLVPARNSCCRSRPCGQRTKPRSSLTVLTSQVTPVLNNQPDPAKALRQEKAVELPAKATDGAVTLLVPANLSAPVYDVTIQADLLAADKKVLATAYTPVRRLEVRQQLIVTLAGPERLAVPLVAKKGTTVKIQGKIERREGLKADVTLALTGLPAGVKAAPVTLKGDATDFTLTVFLPPNLAVGEIKGLKLTGSFAPNAKQPNVRVRRP